MEAMQESANKVEPQAARAGRAVKEGDEAAQPMSATRRRTMIAEYAYALYQKRGSEGGDPHADWIEAEAVVDRMLLGGIEEGDEEHRQRDSFYTRMESQLREWDASLAELRGKARRKGTALRDELNEQLAALEVRRKDVQTRLDALRGQTGGAWHDLKAGLETAWEDLRHAVRNMAGRFK